MNYVDKEEIINEIKNTLSSYFKSNIIDESFVYSPIDNCLSIFKHKTLKDKWVLLKVENYKTKLPEDFNRLIYALRCSTHTMTWTNPHYVTESRPISVCEPKMPCEKTYISQCGNEYRLVQHSDTESFDFHNIELLRVTTDSLDKCSSNYRGANEGLENTIKIVKGQFQTEFRQGNIYVLYESKKNDGLVPDSPKIREAIKNIVIYELFKTMYYNGDGDMLQRMQHAEGKAVVAYSILNQEAKRFEIPDYYNAINNLVSRYKIHENLGAINRRLIIRR